MAERRNPYFKFYPADFMGGVRGLTAQEVGLYTMLLCRIYEEDGPIEDDAFRLATYCGMRVASFEASLEKLVRLGKIDRADGRLFNDRARREISSRADGLEIAIRAGKASAKKRQQKQGEAPASVERPFNHTDTDTDTDTEVRDTNVSLARLPLELPEADLFDDFWAQYPHRNGAKKGKEAARKAWAKAIKARASPGQIIAGAMRYAGDRQVIEGYAKDPSTWLNGKGWEDETEQSTGNLGADRTRPSGPGSGMADAFAFVARQRTARTGPH